MAKLDRIAADHLVGVWRDAEDPADVVIFTQSETWCFTIGRVQYADESYAVTSWAIEGRELVTRERWISERGVPSPDELERRFAMDLRGDELTLTDLDFDTEEVLRRERDPALVVELARPVVRIAPTTRDEPRLGTLRWDDRFPSWRGEIVLDAKPVLLYLDDTDLGCFDRARAVISHLERGGLEPCLAFASETLLELANGWRQEGQAVLDVAAFRARMTLAGIQIGSRVSLAINAGDVFGEHGIDVHLDADLQPVRAEML